MSALPHKNKALKSKDLNHGAFPSTDAAESQQHAVGRVTAVQSTCCKAKPFPLNTTPHPPRACAALEMSAEVKGHHRN